ncbi:MAG: hypothetical protein ACHQF0_13610, partial [Chitinophagales bacterium]
ELAKENIRDYVTGKLFKNDSYQSISYGELSARKGKDPKIAWSIEHKFAITGIQKNADKITSVQKLHRFLFYFDDKMNVLWAESYFE